MKLFSSFIRSAHALPSAFAVLALAPGSLFAGGPSLPTTAPTSAALVANLSTRLRCEKRDKVIVNEFAVEGSGAKYVILRAIGPSLSNFGVPDALRNPTLTLLDAQGNVLDFNDDWVDSPDKEAIIATGNPSQRQKGVGHRLHTCAWDLHNGPPGRSRPNRRGSL